MNWLQKTCSKESILKELKNWGWTSDQARADGLKIWRNGDDFLCSLGDWSKMSCGDVVGAVEKVYPEAEVRCDAECGAPDDWSEVI